MLLIAAIPEKPLKTSDESTDSRDPRQAHNTKIMMNELTAAGSDSMLVLTYLTKSGRSDGISNFGTNPGRTDVCRRAAQSDCTDCRRAVFAERLSRHDDQRG